MNFPKVLFRHLAAAIGVTVLATSFAPAQNSPAAVPPANSGSISNTAQAVPAAASSSSGLGAPAASGTTNQTARPSPTANAANLADRQKMLDLLGITTPLRPGASGTAGRPDSANYDESKATAKSPLPDLLTLKNGKKVTTPEMWWNLRRPEIVEDFDREMYGRVPTNLPKIIWEVTSTTPGTNGTFPIITKQIVGHVDNTAYPQVTVNIQVVLTTPANAGGPVPVMMQFSGIGFGFPGGARGAPGTSGARGGAPVGAAPRGAAPGGGVPWQQQLLAKGWGYALINTGSIQADNGAGLSQGIIGLVNKGQPRKPDDWGVLRAWAWGASKALDYFETDKSVDAKQVGLEGHSRWGKATAVAMAYDQRFAIAYVSSSGEGGAKIWRHLVGETVENIAAPNEYHWMAGNFLKYAGPLTVDDLPVDAHELVAMCAPRPVFIGGGANGDAWQDPKGMFLAGAYAGPVYTLLGKKDLGTTEMPAVQVPLIDGDVAFREHEQGHTDVPNWPTFIAFASRYLKAPPTATTNGTGQPN